MLPQISISLQGILTLTILLNISERDESLNGGVPTKNSKRITPMLQISYFGPEVLIIPLIISGGR